MVPKNEPVAVKLARLEERQIAQESRVDKVEQTANYAVEVAEEAKGAVVRVDHSLSTMPETIIKAIDERGGHRWAIANQWIVVGVAIAAPFIAKWLGV